MTRPIRNTGPCFPSGLPHQRGVLSHTEFYTPIFCMLSVFQAIPFELPRKPPTGGTLLLALLEGTSITINIVPNVKCAPETTARWMSHSRALRYSHTTIRRHQEDTQCKATSSLFPVKMIAKLKWTLSKARQNIEQLQNPTMGVKSTTTEPPP